jgi:hypothetical protein
MEVRHLHIPPFPTEGVGKAFEETKPIDHKVGILFAILKIVVDR